MAYDWHTPDPVDRLDLEDALAELAHDLGKYLRLPLAWLPADASAADVRAATEQALFATRRSGTRQTSAATLWSAFLAEVDAHLTGYSGWAPLVDAVQAALAWSDRLDALDRAAVTRDLSAVAPAIRALLDEVSHG